MKRPSFLLLFALIMTYSAGNAQQILLEKRFPDAWITDALATDDGYIVLGHREREWRVGNVIEHAHTPFLAKLDGDMRSVWEYKFPEGPFRAFRSLEAVENGFLVMGADHHGTYRKRGAAWLAQVNQQGQLTWEKHFPVDGYNSSEGIWVKQLPGGELLAMTRAFRNYNSLGNLRMLRLNKKGELTQSQWVGMDKYYVGLPGVQLNDDGSVLMMGFAYDTKASFQASNARGWVYQIHPDHPKVALLDKLYTNYKDLILSNAMPLADGGWWIVGHARGPKNGKKSGVLLHLAANGHLVEGHTWEQDHGLVARDLIYDFERDRILIAGWSATARSATDFHTHIFEVDQNFDDSEHNIGDKGRFTKLIPFSSGEMLAVSTNGVHLMR